MRAQIVLAFIAFSACLGQEWRLALPGWAYAFPRDHHAHPDFKTEWWYFTGNLFDENGRRFGYELTFFRHGIIPPAQRAANRSRFIVDDLKFAHFTVTDASSRRFHFEQKTSRGAFGEAGFDRGDELAWIDKWSLRMGENGEFHLEAAMNRGRIDLALTPAKPPVIHGENGISAKAAGEGHASHYYSMTRLTTVGTLTMDGKSLNVTGSSWFDHEWATNQLAPHQLGWNWLCVQFNDNTELMLYQMRRDDGSIDPISSGTFVAADGSATHLRNDDFSMMPLSTWKSSKTGANYPVQWRVQVPSRSIDIMINPVLRDQELAFAPLTYWEGAVDVSGTRSGVGYLELTGYAGALSALNR
ncbi:MAG: carotenoid 1,2-hydratase [Verrucomicrobia bacterium]|nr:carotenoid 1,2-hydratase [Verrucomicrobiota bacterium]